MEGTAYETTAFPAETEAGLQHGGLELFQTVASDRCQYFMQKLQFLFSNNFFLDCVEDPNKTMYPLGLGEFGPLALYQGNLTSLATIFILTYYSLFYL